MAKKKDGKYDLDQISHQIMKIQKKKLLTHLDLIEKLHDRYLAIREEGLNDDEEQLLQTGDIKYMEDITLKVGPLLGGIIVSEENLAENTKLALKSMKEFDLFYNKVNEEIEAMEALEDKSDKNSTIERMPVKSFIHDLAAEFGELKKASTS